MSIMVLASDNASNKQIIKISDVDLVNNFVHRYIGDKDVKVLFLMPSPNCPSCAYQSMEKIMSYVELNPINSMIITNNNIAINNFQNRFTDNFIIDFSGDIDFLPIDYKVYTAIVFTGNKILHLYNYSEKDDLRINLDNS